MLKSVAMGSLAIALGLAVWLLPMRGEQATAQSGPLHILVVEYDIVPAEIDKYLTAIKELEHVPPRLNQGDSRGAKDGRVYRH